MWTHYRYERVIEASAGSVSWTDLDLILQAKGNCDAPEMQTTELLMQ